MLYAGQGGPTLEDLFLARAEKGALFFHTVNSSPDRSAFTQCSLYVASTLHGPKTIQIRTWHSISKPISLFK